MNSLLIYNENIAPKLVFDFRSASGTSYNFQIGKQELLNPDFTIDKKIDDILKGGNDGIPAQPYDCIFIPYSLSVENYTEFLGLRFAYHIRLTNSFNNIQTPIVFFGDENSDELNKLSKLANILYTRGIYQTKKISIQDFQNQITYINENFETIEDEIFMRKFLNTISVVPSGNYSTHHSITNEWAIYRWAKALNIEDGQIKKIESTIGSNLYFKYLKAKYPINEVEHARNQILLKQGKVLYIDDEIEKGWDCIFKQICLNQKYESIGTEFKNIDCKKIVELSTEKVKTFDPDVVILDFRLHDSDFETTKIEDVTGYKILKKIKEYNAGIQVIIFSATNKIWNLLELQKAGADGFILKESPENSVDGNFTQESLEKLITELSVSMKMSPLKSVYERISKVRSNVTFNPELEKLISQKLDTAFLLLNQSRIGNQGYYINHAYLELFQVIEAFLYEVFEEEGNAYVKLNDSTTICVRQNISNKITEAITFTKNNKYEIYKYESEIKKNKIPRLNTNFMVSAVLIFKYGNINSSVNNWTNIYTLRNGKAAHFDKQKAEDIITFEEIMQLCDFLIYFTDIKNENSANLDKALKEKSLNETIDIAINTNPYFKKDDRINKK